MSTLIFDCDGVLADTERYGHLPAFNQTFREFGLPLHWSEEDYGRKLEIGGGKERMASELTPSFVRANNLPEDPAGQAALLATWHRRKTEIYTEMVAAGKIPARAGIPRLISEAQEAGWTLGVASTSAEPSVRAILEHVAGPERAARFDLVLAGDVVPRKKPAPDIYRLALERLAVPPAETLVIEDSRNGLLAAHAAGLRCVMTVNGYTEEQDSSEAILVVTSLGDPDGERTRVIANRAAARPSDYITLGDLERCLAPEARRAGDSTMEEVRMAQTPLEEVDLVLTTMARTIVDNAVYFADLDSVVGDGDFGYSLRNGFEVVVSDYDTFDRSSVGSVLKKIGMVIAGKVGGASGPIWGTAFLRASATAGDKAELTPEDVIAMLRASIAGIMQRGGASLGEKTLLDALVPAVDSLEASVADPATRRDHGVVALQQAADVATKAAEATKPMQAMRGRAAYTGERSIGSVDAGATAIGVILQAISAAWREKYGH